MDLVSNLLTDRLSFVINADWDPTIQLFFKEAELLDVQVAILDSSGTLLFHTMDYSVDQIPQINDPFTTAERSADRALVFNDAEKEDWFYQISQINDAYYLLVAARRPDVAIQSLFQDELVKPLLRTGLFALIGAFVLSWLMAEWITRPLRKISESAKNIAVGKYEKVPIEGPMEVQQLALAMNDMSQKVEKSLQSQRDFVANVSHEFKTPLTSIQGFSQAIYDGTVHNKKDIQHASDVILNETNRLNVLVNDLLTLAKLDAGTMSMTKESVELNRLMQSSIERFYYELEKADIKINPVFSDEIYLYADAVRLGQVFSNLIDNAIKYSIPGSEIQVTISRQGRQAMVTVSDTGPGISEEECARIFERFYQVDKSRQGGTGRGVGLGLAISKQDVEAHGGEISVSSKVGEGSTFMVKLPIEDATNK
ncbi:two-component system sensor histidine kinase [Pelolinea submarina]|nr:two-component system sensor histidine kinase [Pelolinea submarina]